MTVKTYSYADLAYRRGEEDARNGRLPSQVSEAYLEGWKYGRRAWEADRARREAIQLDPSVVWEWK